MDNNKIHLDERQIPTSLGSLTSISEAESGISFKNARLVLIDVPLDRDRVKEILPWGLWPANPSTGIIIMAHYPIFPFGEPYHEAILMVRVRTPMGKGLHCAWILVDNDSALIAGREFVGYPKKMGEFTSWDDGEKTHLSVARRGAELISVDYRPGAPESSPGPVFALKTFNLGGPGQLLAISPMLLFKPREIIHESHEASVDLKLNHSVFDPVAGLVAGDPISARVVRADFLSRPSYYLWVGLSGGRRWFLNTYNMRYR